MPLNNDQWQEALVLIANAGTQDNIALVPSAAYTTTQTSADQTNPNARGVVAVLDISPTRCRVPTRI